MAKLTALDELSEAWEGMKECYRADGEEIWGSSISTKASHERRSAEGSATRALGMNERNTMKETQLSRI